MPGKFNLPYAFKVDNKEVVIQHKGGGAFNQTLRVKPGDLDAPHHAGGDGEFARWEVIFVEGGAQVRIKSKKTGKYLRITGKGEVDVGGGTGPWTVFKVHQQGQAGVVKLESRKSAGKYIAVGQNNAVRTGDGGPWTELRFFREGSNAFAKPYEFAVNNTVVAMHQGTGGGGEYKQSLRVNPGNNNEADPNGGKGEWAQFTTVIKKDGGLKCAFKGKGGGWLRIQGKQGKINFGGGEGGPLTWFKVDKKGIGAGGGRIARLESNAFPGKYVAVQPGNKIAIGNGGKWTELQFFRKN